MPGPTEHQAPGAIDLASAPLTATSWPAGADDPKVLFLYHANPVASLPDPGAARQALARVPLVVSFSPFFDESARCAHLILPDHTYLERWQDAVAPAAVPSPVWGVVRPVVKPLQNTRATGDVILGLAARMGGSAAAWARWKSVEDLVHERGLSLASAGRGSAFVDRFRQRELGEVEGRGWWLPHGQKPEEFWQSIVESGGWFDPLIDYEDGAGRSQFPDGRVWMFPVEARERLAKSGRALAEGFLPLDAPLQAPEVGTRDFPLQLVPFRVMTLASGGTPLMPWLLEHLGALDGSAWETWIEIGTETARSAGLDSGQRVRVESSRGRFEATVRVSPGAQPGVVSVPYGLHSRVEGWGEPNGANPLAAVGRAIDPLSGLPDWASTRVRVVRI
jgi:anaerobic selenocysteine-containing dehydrogenase